MTWLTKRQLQRQRQWQWQRQRQWQRHLEKTQKERPKRHVTIETFDKSESRHDLYSSPLTQLTKLIQLTPTHPTYLNSSQVNQLTKLIQLTQLTSNNQTHPNISAVFPPVYKRMTRMRLFPRAGKVTHNVVGIRKHSRFGKENSLMSWFQHPNKSLPTGWMNSILYRGIIFSWKISYQIYLKCWILFSTTNNLGVR